jgi:hypothetical protein
MTFSLAGDDIGSIDGYAASIVPNVADDVTAISVPTSGVYKLRVRTATKNAASSNYYGYLIWIRLVQREV